MSLPVFGQVVDSVAVDTTAHKPRKHLKEVIVTDKTGEFNRTRMRGIENLGIYEGKKSEVIIMDQLVANLSTNNARQVYSRVPGLNIYETDGAGIQLNVGGRGLDPNRSSNFNVRQNGYDISADALGYPESYYTPATEALSRIQVVRGAASLQYGTQFGGLLNFVMKQAPKDKRLEVTARQTIGSFNFYNAFTSAGGTLGKFSYYVFYQYKKGDGWRPNSEFKNHNAYANLAYRFNDKTTLGLDLTTMQYLAHQPGGLTDKMFIIDPRQSNRERNWFKVNWNLWALHLDHKFNESNEFNLRVYGLLANRYSLGFRPNIIDRGDDGSYRDLIKGKFNNVGAEARYLHRYEVFSKMNALLVGARYYNGFNTNQQGYGSTGRTADFNFVENLDLKNDYRHPNKNYSLFAENVIYLNERWSVTPGLRGEFIDTRAIGYYSYFNVDIAGNPDPTFINRENRKGIRKFVIGGIGVSYKPFDRLEFYTNISQNYRSITFGDMRVDNPSAAIDPNLKDEKGYSFDIGARSQRTTFLNYDVSAFFLNYNNRIGERLTKDNTFGRVIRLRANVGQAVIMGLESYGEIDIVRGFNPNSNWSTLVFGNLALITSKYIKSDIAGITGNKVEFIPDYNIKTGLRLGYKGFKASVQFTAVGDQFTDATNAVEGRNTAAGGIIPSYEIYDLSLSYEWRRYKLEGSINNMTNQMYFTRRATGYPGPGILPSDGRGFFITAQIRL